MSEFVSILERIRPGYLLGGKVKKTHAKLKNKPFYDTKYIINMLCV